MSWQKTDQTLDDWAVCRQDVMEKLGWPSTSTFSRIMETGAQGGYTGFSDPTMEALSNRHTRDILYSETAYNLLSECDQYILYQTYMIRGKKGRRLLQEEVAARLQLPRRTYQRHLSRARRAFARTRRRIIPSKSRQDVSVPDYQ